METEKKMDHDFLVQELIQLVTSGDFNSNTAKVKLSFLPQVLVTANSLLLVDTILKEKDADQETRLQVLTLAIKNMRDALDRMGEKLKKELAEA